MSAGCNQPPPAADKETAFVKHDIAVTGVSAAYISAHPLPATTAPYSFTMRNYYVKLPTGYDPSKPYRVQMGGTGCGGNATVGSEGGYLPSAHADVLLISPSYVPTQGGTSATNPGSCFADSGTDTPEVAYFDAMLAEVSKTYCIDPTKVGVSGYSSGAWEALLLGWARAGVVRGIATEAGGLRANRPPGSNKPVAALMIATLSDTENPVNLAPTDAKAISLGASGGSGQARDEILARNGCTGTATADWDPTYPLCKKYTGCPAAYPVVWCGMTTGGHYPAHPPYTPDAMTKFLATLPEIP
jgi:poly(3-hydroxybutyrate) depolymerase